MFNCLCLSIPETSTTSNNVSAVNRGAGGGSGCILEPILEEETDEEAGWSLRSYETTTSSGDSCESVVQLAEVNFLPGLFRVDDQDTVSERDFLCPPKRRKQEVTTLFAESFNTPPSSLKVNQRYRFDSFEPDYHKKR